jgi:predicted dehydrogenase
MAHLNVALIGYAFMGRAHSNAYRQVGRFFSPRHLPRMKVLCGRTASSVKAAAEQLGWEEAATDWREVVNRKDIDIIDISTPGDSHAEIAIEAAKAGKVVFCEKPLANTVKEAERMLAAVKKAGVIHMICHNYRRVPAVMLAKQLIDEGRLGRLYHFRGTYLQDWVADPSVPLYWRLRKEAAGSGALGDIASHSLDLGRYLVGEITEVTGALETFVKERPLPENPKKKGKVTVDDASASVVRFANGALGTIEASRFATGRKNYNRFEINGSKGSIVFNFERMNELDVFLTDDDRRVHGFHNVMVTDGSSHPYFSHWWPEGHLIGYEHTFIHTVYDLLEAIAKDKVPTPNFEDGVRNQKVLAAMEKAAQTKRWVTVAT